MGFLQFAAVLVALAVFTGKSYAETCTPETVNYSTFTEGNVDVAGLVTAATQQNLQPWFALAGSGGFYMVDKSDPRWKLTTIFPMEEKVKIKAVRFDVTQASAVDFIMEDLDGWEVPETTRTGVDTSGGSAELTFDVEGYAIVLGFPGTITANIKLSNVEMDIERCELE